MNYARPIERPQPDNANSARCLENRVIAPLHRHPILRGRKGNGLRDKHRFLDAFSRIAELSYGTRGTGNALVQGENLRVLNALQSRYAGRVRCVYIDRHITTRSVTSTTQTAGATERGWT